jgi:hypothetical protein
MGSPRAFYIVPFLFYHADRSLTSMNFAFFDKDFIGQNRATDD